MLPQSFVAPGNYSDLKSRQTVFAQISGLFRSELNLTGSGEPEKLEGFAAVDGAAFEILDVKPVSGRLFLPDEYVDGANRVVLISHGFWQRHFGGAADAVGKTLTLSTARPFSHSTHGFEEKFIVVGVLPANFQYFNPNASFWVPAGFKAKMMSYRYAHNLTVLARLRPDVTPARAQAEIGAIMKQVAQDHPVEAGKLGAFVQPLSEHLTGESQRPLLILLATAGLVLLIACANLANLLLARAVARRQEIALRIALGAGRWRIVRQLLTESVLLAVAGGSGGLVVAGWSFSMLRQLIPPGLPVAAGVGLNWQVLAYTLGLSVLTGLLFGLVPAWQATRVEMNEALKQGGVRSGASHRRWQKMLVVGEIALALVLLIGAGLLIRTFHRLQQVEVGFRIDHLLTAQTRLPSQPYDDSAKRVAFYRQTLERVRALPGVISAAYTSLIPTAGVGGVYSLTIEGRSTRGGVAMESGHRQISPDYFTTLGIPLRQGRPFDESDTLQTPPVAIVNETLARRFFPDGSPLGKQLALDEDGLPAAHPLTIVGVVGDVKHHGLENEIRPELYLPHAQIDYNISSIPAYLIVRTIGDPRGLETAVRNAVHAADSSLPVTDVRTMEERLDGMIAQRRLQTTLLTAYAALALVLAAVGIYGALSYFVTRHTAEIGLRLALGAQHGTVLRWVLRKGLGLALGGVGSGLIAAWVMTRSIKSLLFGVSPTDPLTFVTIALLLLGVALAACWIPARRAMKVDPIIALRGE